MMTLDVSGETRLLTVLLGFVVLLSILEKAVVAGIVMRRNFLGVVSRPLPGVRAFTGVRNLRLTCAGLVSMLIGLTADCTLLPPTVFLVLSQSPSSIFVVEI